MNIGVAALALVASISTFVLFVRSTGCKPRKALRIAGMLCAAAVALAAVAYLASAALLLGTIE